MIFISLSEVKKVNFIYAFATNSIYDVKFWISSMQGLKIKVCNKKISYFSAKTYVVGTQKNILNETVLLSTPSKCLNVRIKK